MTLGFSTHINGKPTYFVEKIWNGIYEMHYQEYWICFEKELQERNIALHKAPATLSKKIHTIRADPKDRWKPGNKIHMVTGNRTPKRFQFAPVLECVSTQEIEIKWTSSPYHKICFGLFIEGGLYGTAYGQDKITDVDKTIYDLAINDGFDSLDDFFQFFDEDFTGKIIHWTGHKY
jgi:hypothetical protein